MSKTDSKIAQIAAEWWADQIASPCFDNGDNSKSGAFGSILARSLIRPVPEANKRKFVECLSAAIEKALGKWSVTLSIGVDYAPDAMLREAAKEAEISNNNFPWKTNMDIGKNYIAVHAGHHGKLTFLYSTAKYWERQIAGAKESIEEYKSGTRLYWVEDEAERKKQCAERVEETEEEIKKYEANLAKAREREATT